MISYLDAKHHGGEWHLRIDDIDTGRCITGADKHIIACLYEHGFRWQGDIVYQTAQYAHYHAALSSLKDKDCVYGCDCPRKRTAGKRYDRYCLHKTQALNTPFAQRYYAPKQSPLFDDIWQGKYLPTALDDIIVWRKDQLCAYQLAVVVDDHQLGATHIIRGADLLPPTPAQAALYESLGYTLPTYGHFPVLLDNNGNKLSKQNHAPPLQNETAVDNLKRVLKALGQAELPASATTPATILAAAVDQWDRTALPNHNIAWHNPDAPQLTSDKPK